MNAINRSVFFVISVLLLSGCVKLWQDNVEIKTYMIQVDRTAGRVAGPLAQKLWIEDVHVLSPFNVRSLIIRESDVEFSVSYYSELLLSPSENFRNGVYGWLSDSGLFETVSVVDRKGLSHRLVATVTDFYSDRASKKTVLKMKVSLFDESNREMNVLLYKDYMHTVDIQEETTDGVMRCYNEAYTAILQELEQDLVAALQ